MKEQTRNVIVGLTTLAGVALLIVLLVLFGYVPTWVEGGYVVTVGLDDGGGLNEGSRVRLNGIDIGRVEKVALTQLVKAPAVTVRARIKDGILVPRGARVGVQTSLLGGSGTLAFDISHITPDKPEYGQMLAPLPQDGSAFVKGEEISLASQITKELRGAIEGPTKSMNRVADDFNRLTEEWAGVGQNIRQLTESRKSADVDAGLAPANLATVLQRADARLVELQTTFAAINKWVDDPAMRDNLRDTLANSAKFSARLGTTADKADNLLDSANENLTQLTKRYVAVADDLSAAINGMKKVTDEALAGKGTMGKLLTDPALYDNLNDAAQRLGAALREFHLLMAKMQKEGLPLKF